MAYSMSKRRGKYAGSCEQSVCRAFGPPVETPMAIERAGLAPVCFNFGEMRAGGGGGLQASLGGPEIAATLILTESSLAICSRPPVCASLGLATKSNAPRASAFKAEYAPISLWLLTTMTGM